MRVRKQYPSQERLRELFDYDPEGFLVWRYRHDMSEKWNKKNEGAIAGSTNIEYSGSYRYRIYINGKYYNGVCLIWVYHNGDIPSGYYVKTKGGAFNGVKIEWLELSKKRGKTHAGNRINWNKNGFFGVRRQKNGFFQAISKEHRDLGTYETLEAAASAYDSWAFSYYGHGFIGNNSGCDDYEEYRVRKGDRPPIATKTPNGFRGVCINPKFPKKSDKQWRSIITVDGKTMHLGLFYEREDAARAYNKAAYDVWGDHAVINDVEDPFARSRHLFWRRGKPKGVSRESNRWRAKLCISSRAFNIGSFDTQEEAARAYNIAAYEHYGELAVLNDIPDPLGNGDIF